MLLVFDIVDWELEVWLDVLLVWDRFGDLLFCELEDVLLVNLVSFRRRIYRNKCFFNICY